MSVHERGDPLTLPTEAVLDVGEFGVEGETLEHSGDSAGVPASASGGRYLISG